MISYSRCLGAKWFRDNAEMPSIGAADMKRVLNLRDVLESWMCLAALGLYVLQYLEFMIEFSGFIGRDNFD